MKYEQQEGNITGSDEENGFTLRMKYNVLERMQKQFFEFVRLTKISILKFLGLGYLANLIQKR